MKATVRRIPYIKCVEMGHVEFKFRSEYEYWLEIAGKEFDGTCDGCGKMQKLKVCVKTRRLAGWERAALNQEGGNR